MPDQLSAAAVAQRYANRPGCRFIGYREVAIAMFSMDIRAVVVEPREIPTVDEFVLRGIQMGCQKAERLARLMGLEVSFVESRLADLLRTELIAVASGPTAEGTAFTLTKLGEGIATSLVRKELNETTLPSVVYHGFLRRFWPVSERTLLRPHEVRELDITQIRPIPARPPRPEELSVRELTRHLRHVAGKRRGKEIEVLSIRAILKGVRTVFLPAVLLQFESVGLRRQTHVVFAVDGVVDDAHERGFAEQKGPEKLEHLLVKDVRSDEEVADEFAPAAFRDEIKTALADADLVGELRTLKGTAAASSVENETATPDTRKVQAARIAELESQLVDATVVLRGPDHPRLLRETIQTATSEIMIVSAFLSRGVVTEALVAEFEQALKRGVQLWIAFGMNARDDRRKRRAWTDAEERLRSLRRRYKKQFRILDEGTRTRDGTHEKILIKDNEFVVIGGFNWLSYAGDDPRGESSMMSRLPQVVEAERTHMIDRFGSQ